MAKLLIKSTKTALAEFDGGIVRASIVWTGKKSAFSATYYATHGLTRDQLGDFTDAINLVVKHVASVQKKTISLKGTLVDPDEQTPVEGMGLSVTYRIFPKDMRYILKFTRVWESGEVLAYLPQMTFSDLPSMVQVGFVANKAKDLMKAYEKVTSE